MKNRLFPKVNLTLVKGNLLIIKVLHRYTYIHYVTGGHPTWMPTRKEINYPN